MNFIRKATELIEFIKEDLPEDLRWIEFKHKIKLGFTQALIAKDEEETD